jgi:hypothetical protein
VEASEELLVVGQAGQAVAVEPGVADSDEGVLEVEVLDTQAQCFEQQAAAAEKAGDKVKRAARFSEDVRAFVMAVEADEVNAPVERGFLSADGIAAQADVFAEAIGDFLLRILLLLSPC